MPQPPRTHFFDDSDQLILEDELQRIRLIGNLDVHSVVTGVVCAVLGHEDGDGKFLVDDYSWAGVSERVQRPLQSGDDRYNIFFQVYHECWMEVCACPMSNSEFFHLFV